MKIMWAPASGHPSGKWRVGKYAPDGTQIELRNKRGAYILFGSYEAAQRRADELNRSGA